MWWRAWFFLAGLDVGLAAGRLMEESKHTNDSERIYKLEEDIERCDHAYIKIERDFEAAREAFWRARAK